MMDLTALLTLLAVAVSFWTSAGFVSNVGYQHPLYVNDAGAVSVTIVGNKMTFNPPPVDAGQPFWFTIGGVDSIGNQYPAQ